MAKNPDFWKYYAKYPPLEKNSKVLPERFPYPICHIGKKNHLWSPCTGDPLDPSKKCTKLSKNIKVKNSIVT